MHSQVYKTGDSVQDVDQLGKVPDCFPSSLAAISHWPLENIAALELAYHGPMGVKWQAPGQTQRSQLPIHTLRSNVKEFLQGTLKGQVGSAVRQRAARLNLHRPKPCISHIVQRTGNTVQPECGIHFAMQWDD